MGVWKSCLFWGLQQIVNHAGMTPPVWNAFALLAQGLAHSHIHEACCSTKLGPRSWQSSHACASCVRPPCSCGVDAKDPGARNPLPAPSQELPPDAVRRDPAGAWLCSLLMIMPAMQPAPYGLYRIPATCFCLCPRTPNHTRSCRTLLLPAASWS